MGQLPITTPVCKNMPSLPDQATLETELLSLISERILSSDPAITLDTNLQSAGLDSLATMQLLVQIERTYGVSLPDADISCRNLGSVRTIARLLKQHEAGA